MNTAILEVLISVISSFLGVNLKDIKASLNKENLKTYRSVSQTARFMRVPIITMLFLSAKTKAEHRNMPPCEALSAALSSRTHRAATSGIRSDFWQESLQIPCIYLKPPLICCPMPLI